MSGVFVLGLPISIIGVKFHEEYQALTSKLEAQEEAMRAHAADEALGASRGIWQLARKILGPNFKPGEDKLTPIMEKKIEIGVENIFKLIDVDGSGFLDRQELGQALAKMGVNLKIESLWRVFKELDTDKSVGFSKVKGSRFRAWRDRHGWIVARVPLHFPARACMHSTGDHTVSHDDSYGSHF